MKGQCSFHRMLPHASETKESKPVNKSPDERSILAFAAPVVVLDVDELVLELEPEPELVVVVFGDCSVNIVIVRPVVF